MDGSRPSRLMGSDSQPARRSWCAALSKDSAMADAKAPTVSVPDGIAVALAN